MGDDEDRETKMLDAIQQRITDAALSANPAECERLALAATTLLDARHDLKLRLDRTS